MGLNDAQLGAKCREILQAPSTNLPSKSQQFLSLVNDIEAPILKEAPKPKAEAAPKPEPKPTSKKATSKKTTSRR